MQEIGLFADNFQMKFIECDENVNYTTDPISPSDEDNPGPPQSVPEMMKFIEKPTLVSLFLLMWIILNLIYIFCLKIKRFVLNFLRSTEDSLPLMYHKSSPTSPEHKLNNILGEDVYNLDKIVSSKFGDSCRPSFFDGEFRRNFIRKTNSANSSPQRLPHSMQRPDALFEDVANSSWFKAELAREVSLEVLNDREPGAFIVRKSSTKPGCFALSLRAPSPGPKVVHYLIVKTERGYKIKVNIHVFFSLIFDTFGSFG